MATCPTLMNYQYTRQNKSSLLQSATYDSNNVLNNVDSVINTLKTGNRIPSVALLQQDTTGSQGISPYTSADVNNYSTKMDELFADISEEYYAYKCNYTRSLDDMLNKLSGGGSSSNDMNGLILTLGELNKRMNALIVVSNKIAKDNYNYMNGLGSNIENINSSLNEQAAIISKHSGVLNSKMGDMDLHKRMVEYTQEKARATENLLSLYFVMNVFAIGALFYVYKA